MKKRFSCKSCDGDGYIEEWKYDEKTGEDQNSILIVSDCTTCDGKGFLMLEVEDNREKSKKKKLHLYPDYK